MKNKTLYLSLVLALSGLWVSCKKDNNDVKNPTPPGNESEVITTLRITLVDSLAASDVRVFEFRDPDGPGGVPYDRFDTIRLDSNRTYLATLLLLNETTPPADTVSREVQNEADDHLFCYTPSGISANVFITDQDSHSLPLGLQSIWHTDQSGFGKMRISLHHQPGVKNGDCSLGETDVEVDFVVRVN